MTQVQNFPRERFTEMTDGNLSTKASALGWPAGFFARNSPSAASGSHGLRPSAILDQSEQRSPTGFTDRACATAASSMAKGPDRASSSTPDPTTRAGTSPDKLTVPAAARGQGNLRRQFEPNTAAWRMAPPFCPSLVRSDS